MALAWRRHEMALGGSQEEEKKISDSAENNELKSSHHGREETRNSHEERRSTWRHCRKSALTSFCWYSQSIEEAENFPARKASYLCKTENLSLGGLEEELSRRMPEEAEKAEISLSFRLIRQPAEKKIKAMKRSLRKRKLGSCGHAGRHWRKGSAAEKQRGRDTSERDRRRSWQRSMKRRPDCLYSERNKYKCSWLMALWCGREEEKSGKYYFYSCLSMLLLSLSFSPDLSNQDEEGGAAYLEIWPLYSGIAVHYRRRRNLNSKHIQKKKLRPQSREASAYIPVHGI